MKKAVNLLFWGYLFVLVRIEFGIDILPEPLGYFIIATGCTRLGKKYPAGQKAWAFATAMIFISFPTIFVNVHEQTHILLNAYSILLMMLQLIVVYFIFRLLKEIAADYEDSLLMKRTNRTFTIYMITHLIYLAASTFSPNLSGDTWMLFILSLMFISLIMDVVFLILVRAVRRKVPETFADYEANNQSTK